MTGTEVALGTVSVVVLAGLLAGAGASTLSRQRSHAHAFAGAAALGLGLALVFALADALLLWLLPRAALSFGPVFGPALMVAWLARLGLLGVFGAAIVLARVRAWRRAATLFLLANLVLAYPEPMPVF